MLVKDIAICLARRDYSETSQITTLFTREHGKVRGLAKGSRRRKSKFSQGFELLSQGQIVFSPPRSGSGLITLTEWMPQNSHQQLRRSLKSLHRAYYLAELMDLFTEELDPHPRLYDLFCSALTNLSADTAGLDCLTFQFNLLQEVGLAPELSRCARCSTPDRQASAKAFSYTQGGTLCPDCAQTATEKTRINPLGLQLLRRFTSPTADTHSLSVANPKAAAVVAHLDDRSARQAQEMLSYWIHAALNREPKTAHLLR